MFSKCFKGIRSAATITAAGLAAALLATCAGTASAQDYKPSDVSKRVRDTCTPDALRLCPSHPLGSNAMVYCMETRARSISRDCQAALEDDGVVPRGHFRRRL